MKINIQAIDCTPRQELLDLINEKLTKLDHFTNQILECKVVLRVEKSEKRDNKVIEVRALIKGNDLFVKKQSESFEEGIQKVYDVLQREVKEWKEKIAS